MKEVLQEYGGTIIAAAGSLAVLAILGGVMLSGNGALAELVRHWIGG